MGGGLKSQKLFEEIISLKNLCLAWNEFKKGKTKKFDVRQFQLGLKNNLLDLNAELKEKTYRHSNYASFYIQDPKLRHIHKACVKDRVLHHAIFRILYTIFDPTFIYDSYSCRLKKGTHRAVNRFRDFARKVSGNNSRTCWVLKCDIKNFFDSIDHIVLIELIKKKVNDESTLWLLQRIIESFSVVDHRGIPMGNITSQLFANIYMNQFDQFIKHQLKVRYYIRYCDDFLILSPDKEYLRKLVLHMNHFLENTLKLRIHPNKIFIKTFVSGIDFLGWVNFYHHRVLRNTTKKRMFKKFFANPRPENFNSYLGLISHGNSYKIKEILIKNYYEIK